MKSKHILNQKAGKDVMQATSQRVDTVKNPNDER